MTRLKEPPFTHDIVGSFLRPARLKQARANAESGTITRDELTRIENEWITELIHKEKENGLYAFTDGEFRRAFWHLDFMAALTGCTTAAAEHWSVAFKGRQPKATNLKIIGRLDFPEDHPFLNHFRFIHQFEDASHIAKQTIPSPSMVHLMTCVRVNPDLPEVYQNNEDLFFEDLIRTYRKALRAFYDAGCRYLQLDDTSWGEFCSSEKTEAYRKRGYDIPSIQKKYVHVINEILKDKPEDLTVTMHICRGNFGSTWFSSGGYEPVAPTLFANCHVDGFFLEYDSARAGGFEPLRYIDNQVVVLGLVTSKTPELEDEDAIKERIREASHYVPLEQLRLSPQCGFASTEEGNILTEDDQWIKIRLIRQIAEDVWKK